MSWLNSEKPPEKWSNSYFKLFVERLRTAVNHIDSDNFPEGISGLWLRDKSVSLRKISGYGGLIFTHDFFALVDAKSVTSTSEVTLGSPVYWTPLWKNLATVYLELTGYVSDADSPATIYVNDSNGTIFSRVVNNTTIERIQEEIEVMPNELGTLVFRAKVTASNKPLTIVSARIILKLKE